MNSEDVFVHQQFNNCNTYYCLHYRKKTQQYPVVGHEHSNRELQDCERSVVSW